MSTPSDYRRDEYTYQSRKWRQVRDTLQGDIALKDHDYARLQLTAASASNVYYDLCETAVHGGYLREINSADNRQLNRERNAQYIKCAIFMNATKNTLRGMTGLIFRQAPIVELPNDINYIIDDADGNGLQLNQQMKSVTNHVVSVGRHGMFVDFPKTENPTTVEEAKLGQRAYINEYMAEQIINWRTVTVGAVEVLSLVVLVEIKDVQIDDFQSSKVQTKRILKLVDGLYEMEVRKSIGSDGSESVEVFFPEDGNGNRMDFIPFVFVGSENNNQNIDDVPLYDISVVNIGHYRNSADVEENSYFASQLTVTSTGMTQAWIDNVWKGVAQVGSRGVLTGPEGSSFGSIQANESNLARSLMKDKEDQMARLGAKFIEPSSANKTATQSKIDSADSTSSLATISANVNDAYNQVITWVQLFMRSSGEFNVEINSKFGIETLSAQDLTSFLSAVQQGGMSVDTLLWNIKKGHRIPEDISIEEEKEKIMADQLGFGVESNDNEEDIEPNEGS